MSGDSDATRTVNDLYEIMATSVELQKKTLACLEQMQLTQQLQVQQKTNSGAGGDGGLGEFKKEILKWLLNSYQTPNIADLEKTTSPSFRMSTPEAPTQQRSTKAQTPAVASSSKKLNNDTILALSRNNRSSRASSIKTDSQLSEEQIYKEISTQHLKSDEEEITELHWARSRRSQKNCTNKRVVVPCQDDDRRDIEKTPEVRAITGCISNKSRIDTLVAQLLSESFNSTIKPDSNSVQKHVDSLKGIVKKIHAHMINHVAKKNNTSIREIVGRKRWSQIADEVQDMYSLFLERKVLKDYGLNIGRCKNMWAARMLLSSTTSTKTDKRSITSAVSEIEKHVNWCYDNCEETERALANSKGLPLSLVNRDAAASGSGSSSGKYMTSMDPEVLNNQDMNEVEEDEEEEDVFGENDNDEKEDDSSRKEREESPVAAGDVPVLAEIKGKVTSCAATIKFSTTKIPIVIPADDGEDDSDYMESDHETSSIRKIVGGSSSKTGITQKIDGSSSNATGSMSNAGSNSNTSSINNIDGSNSNTSIINRTNGSSNNAKIDSNRPIYIKALTSNKAPTSNKAISSNNAKSGNNATSSSKATSVSKSRTISTPTISSQAASSGNAASSIATASGSTVASSSKATNSTNPPSSSVTNNKRANSGSKSTKEADNKKRKTEHKQQILCTPNTSRCRHVSKYQSTMGEKNVYPK